MQNSKSQKISELKEKIEILQKAYAGDVLASYKEAAQTEAMLNIYRKQLEYLEKSPDTTNDKSFVLRTSEGETKEFIVTSGIPDPSNGIITSSSPIGANLIKSKKGDKIQIGPKEFIVSEVN